MSDDDPRLAAVYDIDNPDGVDHDFFRRVADDIGAERIVDLGCGTGLLTVTLAQPGRAVTGVVPAAAMLERAASRRGGDIAPWVRGTSDALEPDSADLVIMSGNVAMRSSAGCPSVSRPLRRGCHRRRASRGPRPTIWPEPGVCSPTAGST